MAINSLTAGAASQLSYTGRLSGTSTTTATGQTPPPPPGDGGGLLGAIADALKSVGIGGTDDTGSTSASTSTSETGSDSEAQALGSFLENLMGALHAQNSGSPDSAAQYGEPPQGGPGLGGGPGKLASDLQSLISSLDDGIGGTGGTESAASTDSVAGTEASDSTAALQSSFKSLLTALGGDGSDASSKLSSFLQTLSSRLPSAGSAGNLINTTA